MFWLLENKYNDIGWVQNDTTQTQSRLIYGTRECIYDNKCIRD